MSVCSKVCDSSSSSAAGDAGLVGCSGCDKPAAPAPVTRQAKPEEVPESSWGLSGCSPSTPPVKEPVCREEEMYLQALGRCENMVQVRGGRFTMGYAAGEEREGPERTVEVEDFWIDRYEVTVFEYEDCVTNGGCTVAALPELVHNHGEAFALHPMTGVTWTQAKQFCEWRRKALPSEEQWEYAARGKDGRVYPWGAKPPSCDVAVTWTPEDGSGCGAGMPMKTGSRRAGASPWGAQDMAGNVWEWVDTSSVDTEGRLVGYVKRGGSWDTPALDEKEGWWRIQLRSTFSRVSPPDAAYHNTGFRCVW